MRDAQVNYEDFLTTLLQLARRHELEVWPIVDRLCEPIESILRVAPGRLDALYQTALEGLRRELTQEDRSKLKKPYLERLIDFALEGKRPSIYTLNYDLAVEAVLEDRLIPYANGFRKSSTPTQDALDDFDELVRDCLQAGQVPLTLSEFFNADFETEFWPAAPRSSTSDSSTGLFDLTPIGTVAKMCLVKVHGSLDWFRIIALPR